MHGEVVVALDVWVHDGHHLAAVPGQIGLHLHRVREHALVPLWEVNMRDKMERIRIMVTSYVSLLQDR